MFFDSNQGIFSHETITNKTYAYEKGNDECI